LPAGITEAITVGIFIFVGKQNGMNDSEINCVATMLMAVVGTLVIINISRPFTKYKLFVIIFNAVFLVVNIILAFFVPLLKEYYDFDNLSKKSWIIWGIFSVSSVLLFVLLTFLFNKIKIKTPKYMERMFDNE
jgi:cation-transporting ATPase E